MIHFHDIGYIFFVFEFFAIVIDCICYIDLSFRRYLHVVVSHNHVKIERGGHHHHRESYLIPSFLHIVLRVRNCLFKLFLAYGSSLLTAFMMQKSIGLFFGILPNGQPLSI